MINPPTWLLELTSNQLSAFSSLILTVLTFWLAILTRTLAKETRLTREAGERAEVQCALEPHEEYVNQLELVLVNIGKVPAKSVEIFIDCPFTFAGRIEREPLKLNMASILPNTKFRISLGDSANIKDKIVRIRILYLDKFGVHENCFEESAQGWMGFRQSSHNPLYSVAISLKNIEKTLDHWNGFARLNVDVFNETDRQAESSKRNAWLHEMQAQATQPPATNDLRDD